MTQQQAIKSGLIAPTYWRNQVRLSGAALTRGVAAMAEQNIASYKSLVGYSVTMFEQTQLRIQAYIAWILCVGPQTAWDKDCHELAVEVQGVLVSNGVGESANYQATGEITQRASGWWSVNSPTWAKALKVACYAGASENMLRSVNGKNMEVTLEVAGRKLDLVAQVPWVT
jgi:hypothetical protein